MAKSISGGASYFEVLAETLRHIPSDAVDQIAGELLDAYAKDRSIFVFGNGGSAATASHFACDLGKGTARTLPSNARRFRVTALTDNVPVITAWANDLAYKEIFTEQLRSLLRPGDLCFAISASGNSENIVRALAYARSGDCTTVGLAGFDGGLMKSLCCRCVVVPSDNMEIVEDLHLAVCHSLSTTVRTALFESSPAGLRSPAHHLPPAPVVCSDSVTNSPPVLDIATSRVESPPFASQNRFDAD